MKKTIKWFDKIENLIDNKKEKTNAKTVENYEGGNKKCTYLIKLR